MTFRSLIRRTILRWLTWRHERRLPELALVNREITSARRKHRPVRHLERARRDIVHARLRLEISR